MLRYIKRQASRRHSNDDAGSGAATLDADVVDCAAAATAAQKRHSLRSTTSFCDEFFLEQLTEAEEEAALTGCSRATDEDIFKNHSRLSMTLAAIVSEPNCLSYFVQYLETRNSLPLIKFYLDIENFKRAALTILEQEQQYDAQQELDGMDNCEKDTTMHKSKASMNAVAATETQQEAEEEDNDVPELKTLCDLSMRKPLTDDEKSRIYAETNKQLNRNQSRLKASSEMSLCSALSDHCERAISAASISDAIAIYQKYLIVNARQFVELPIGILSHISLLLCGKSTAGEELEMPIPASCFDEARDYVLQQLERESLQGFLQSSYYCKYCVELIEGTTAQAQLNIYDVLYSELALFYFTEYLEQQQERQLLEFWITAINFRKSCVGSLAVDTTQAQADAMIIYERYFSLQSACRLWMSDKLRSRVEQTICAPGLLAYAFDLSLQVTAKYLEQKYFADFLKSNIFDNYVNELKAKQGGGNATTINAATVPAAEHKLSLRRAPKLTAQQRHRKTMSMSDCTHISQHNTLLASMDTAKPPAANMNIDSRQLTNPQLLWQRPTAGGLKFGRVNSLGRYERDFEAIDAVALKSQQSWSLSASGNKIKNAMRKLVNLPEDNVQEEIAWQVAEMIVKDVTNVTLNSQAPMPRL